MSGPRKATSLFLVLCFSLVAVGEEYSRTQTYHDEVIVRCSNKNLPTVQVLQDYSDVMHYGLDSVDLRLKRKTFTHVQSYFPNCHVIVQNLELAVQQAEAQMFPKKTREQDKWMRTVVQSVLPWSDSEEVEQEALSWVHSMKQDRFFFEKYHNYSVTVDWYKSLARRKPSLVKFVPSIGKTGEGRDMPCVHITASRSSTRKRFYIQCMIHAREWISGAVCMAFAARLVKEYNVVSSVTNILNNLEIILVPFVNPDGYVYTWTSDRLWRKNRNYYKNSDSCVGVDINRNFPEGFKKKNRYCAADYGGPFAKSEKETQHVIKYFQAHPRIIGSLDIHSYGQLLLRPYGMTNKTYPDEPLHREIGSNMAKKIKNVHGSNYVSQRSQDLYPCYGIAADWFYSEEAARKNGGYRSASFCVELRSTSPVIGFILPENQILPTAEEVYPAILYYMKTMLDKPIKYSSGRFNSVVDSDMQDDDYFDLIDRF